MNGSWASFRVVATTSARSGLNRANKLVAIQRDRINTKVFDPQMAAILKVELEQHEQVVKLYKDLINKLNDSA